MASLDPLPGMNFMATVMAAMADDGVSVVLSSHALAELERVADYLVILSAAAVSRWPARVDGPSACHRVLSGPDADADGTPNTSTWCTRCTARRRLILNQDGRKDRAGAARLEGPLDQPRRTRAAYLREPGAASLPGPRRARHAEPTELAR